MRDKLMNGLQRFAKAMFIPILILPVVGILIALGSLLTNPMIHGVIPFLDHPVITGFGSLLSGSLISLLTDLGLIFAVGIAVGLAVKKKAEAGFLALLGFLVFISAMNRFMDMNGTLAQGDSLASSGQTMVLGMQVLDMGIFLGIIIGVLTAFVHNRYIDKEFKNAFQIYGGARFVFILLIPFLVILAVVFTTIWPYLQSGISAGTALMAKSGNIGLFFYGMLDRLLIPTGLHHLVYTPFLYSSIGGVQEVGGVIFEGSRSIYLAEMADHSVQVLSQSVIWDARGISKMFGLIGASLAMYQKAKPKHRGRVKLILVPAAVTAFLSGVTEPLEFTFLFVSPVLFAIHSALSGLSMVVLNLLGVRAIGPNGMLDFVLYNVPLGVGKTGWPMFLVVGVIFFFIYYLIFSILIKAWNLKTIGREDGEVRLYDRKDYEDKHTKGIPGVASVMNDNHAELIVSALGGKENIKTVDNCYTRLRLVLYDADKLDAEKLKNDTGASGVVRKGDNVQIVYGVSVERVRKSLDEYLGNSDT
ncbi:MAG TPA: PTS transporter subunit EIIC [Bacteroidales bacterium]|nr:PTS transporter subunit EIIC [Bacteroidales bacterium]